MATGRQRKWALTVLTVTGLLALPFGIWTALPVSHGDGPIKIYARPERLGSHYYEIVVKNTCSSDLKFDVMDTEVTSDSFPIGCGNFSDEVVTLKPKAELTENHTFEYHLFSPNQRNGLHRIPVYLGYSRTETTPQTQVWVLKIGDRVMGIK